MKSFDTIVSVITLIILTASSARSEFRAIVPSRVESCSFKLTEANGIPHRCLRAINERAKLAVWGSALSFDFGRLQRWQWQKLARAYASWHNPNHLSPYDANRHYNLMHFMPPLIQALDQHQFHTQHQRFGGISLATANSAAGSAPLQASLATNCWGLLYEILRLAQLPQVEPGVVFMTGIHPMLDLLRQHSSWVEGTHKPGDIVLIYHRYGQRDYLDHTVLVVDKNLYFEKAGSGDEVPYRLIDGDTLRKIWHPDVYTFESRRPRSDIRLQQPHRQFSLNNPKTIPADASIPAVLQGPIGSQFTGDWSEGPVDGINPMADATYFWIKRIPTLNQENGRFRLPERAYNPKAFLMNRF
jgi:hypothetical protein